MEDGDTEKYHPSRVIQDFVFLSRKMGCIRCISLQVYTKIMSGPMKTIFGGLKSEVELTHCLLSVIC